MAFSFKANSQENILFMFWNISGRAFVEKDETRDRRAVSVDKAISSARKQIPALKHPPYPPDFSSREFIMFPELKISLQGSHFGSLEDIQNDVTMVLKLFWEIIYSNVFRHGSDIGMHLRVICWHI
jgi:hypothetical protein